MKKILMFLILGIFLLSFASAIQKDYDPSTRTLKIDSSFLGIKTGSIAEVQLITPLNYKVGLGYQYVWEQKVTGFKDYNDFITQIDLYDKENGMAKFNRDYDLKKKEMVQVSVNDYTYSNQTTANGTIKQVATISGNHIENREVWTKLQRVDFKKNEILFIRMYTNVEEDDVVEWIPTIAGFLVPEWAEWTADLNVGIISYYTLNESSGTAYDSLGLYNLTNTGVSMNQTGLIGTSGLWTVSTSDKLENTNFDTSPTSINMWTYLTSATTSMALMSFSGSGNTFSVYFSTTTGIKIIDWNGANSGTMTAIDYTPYFNKWTMVTAQYDGTNWDLYLDGSYVGGMNGRPKLTFSPNSLKIGNHPTLSRSPGGRIDETTFWSRELTQSELTQVNNSGIGITYTNIFGTDPIVTAIEPNNAIIYKISPVEVNFTCYGSDAENFSEMEFYLDGTLNESNSSGINNTNYIFPRTLTDGDYNWSCIGYDNESNTGTFPTRTLEVNTTPFIEFISPSPTQGEEIKVNGFNVTVNLTEAYFENLTFYLYNSSELVDSATYTDSTRTHQFTNVQDGNYFINATTWTTTEQFNKTETRSFLVHTSIPIINITSPLGILDYFLMGNNETLNYDISELGQNQTHFNECWFEYNNTEVLLNSSYTPAGIDFEVWVFPSNYANVTAVRDNLLTITEIPEACSRQGNFTLTATNSGLFNYNWLCLNDVGGYSSIGIFSSQPQPTPNITANQKRPLNCSGNTTSFEYVLGKNNLCVHAIDEFGLHSENTTTWEYKLTEIDQTYNAETTEGSLETFLANIRLGSGYSISSAVLFSYNNTMSTGQSFLNGSNTVLRNADFLIPNVNTDQNISFYWSITLSDSTSLNLSSQNQTIYNLVLDNCTSGTVELFNFTVVDEELQTILPTATIETAINIFDETRSQEIINYSNIFNGINPLTICLNRNVSSSSIYSVDVLVRYEDLTSANEYYNIVNSELTNGTESQAITLYDLNLSDSTEFQLSFTGSDFLPVENALVYVDRQYISENTFKTVELPKTDYNGQSVLHLVRNDVIYNVRIIKDGVVLGNFENLVAFCDDFTIGDCNIELNAFDSVQKIFKYDEAIGILFTDPEYNETSSNVLFNFVTSDGTAKTVRLEVSRNDIFGNRSVCSSSLISSGGTLTCEVDPNIDESTLKIEVYVDEVLAVVDNVAIDSTNWGVAGYLVMFVMALSFVFMFSGSKTGILISLGVTMAGSIGLGLVSGDMIGIGASGMWLIVIIVIGIYKLNKERAD